MIVRFRVLRQDGMIRHLYPLASVWLCSLIAGIPVRADAAAAWAEIRVVDSITGRGVPLVG